MRICSKIDVLTFLRCEAGAVTVDWTVLAAAIVGMGVASVGAVRTGTSTLGDGVRASLESAVVWGAGNKILGNVMDTAGLATRAWGWRTGSGNFAGWDVVTGGGLNVVRSGYNGVISPNGEHFISLETYDGVPVTAMARTVEGLTAGQPATLSFNTYDNGGGRNSMNVYFGGELVGVYSPGRQVASHSVQIVAGMGDGSNRLTFENNGSGQGGGGMWLNDIQLQQTLN
jgi:hypothetical protein